MTQTIVTKNVACAVITLMLGYGTTTFAQTPQTPQPPSPAARVPAVEKAMIPLKVQLTLSRYQGEKRTESLPFTLWVTANDTTNPSTTLNLGTRVPTGTRGPDGPTYNNLGTNLSANASSLDEGRFRLTLTISDTSLEPSKDPGLGATLQSFGSSNHLILRDGQTAQFLMTTDKITGEVTKVEVTLSVLK